MKTSRELLDVQTMLGSPSWRFFVSFVEERRQANAAGAKAPIVDLAGLFPRERLLGAEETLDTLVRDFENFTKDTYKTLVEKENQNGTV